MSERRGAAGLGPVRRVRPTDLPPQHLLDNPPGNPDVQHVDLPGELVGTRREETGLGRHERTRVIGPKGVTRGLAGVAVQPAREDLSIVLGGFKYL